VHRWRRHRELRKLYGQADTIICVSNGVARSLGKILERSAEEFHVLPNPVVTPELDELAAQPIDHPWFTPGQPPVILGVGRLCRIKNFPLLIKALALVRQKFEARLVILGEGKHRAKLTDLAVRLEIGDAVDMPGFVENPYAFLSRAGLFVLSSRWEGFGNVLVEALACGIPVVATDCPSGPSEILRGGYVAPLVPVDDEIALSEAMLQSLLQVPNRERLRQAATPYTQASSCDAYLRAFGFAVPK
jgi:glycosyltransferase involved in cell wall biosynthesis